jgi:hypothetical protein
MLGSSAGWFTCATRVLSAVSLYRFSFKLARVIGSPFRLRSLKMLYWVHTVSNSYLSTQVVRCKPSHCVFFNDVLIKSQFLTYNFAIYFSLLLHLVANCLSLLSDYIFSLLRISLALRTLIWFQLVIWWLWKSSQQAMCLLFLKIFDIIKQLRS